MLDGVIANPTYNDVFDFADYHVDNIERIEIIRGSYSALYGSDAIGGVINIITKEPEKESQFFISGEGGSFYTHRELISAISSKYSFSIGRTDSEGDYDRDQYENNTLSLNLVHDFSEDSSLNFISRYIETKKDIAILINAINIESPLTLEPRVILDQNAATERKTFINSLTYKNMISDFWDFSLKGSYFDFRDIEEDEEEEGLPFTVSFLNSDTTSKRYTLETQHNFYIKEIDTITAGAIYEREEVDHSSNTNLTFGGLFPELFPEHVAFKKHRTNLGGYIQNIFNWDDRLIFITGGRIDHYETFGTIFSPKISSSYFIELTKTKFKASYGHGFHAPSFDQLYSIPLGNTDLDPERSKSFDIGFDQLFGDGFLKLGAVYFDIYFEDLIVKDFSIFKFINAEKARSSGIESYIKFTPIKGLVFNANYTYTDTKNIETGEELFNIPRYMLNFNISYDINERFNINSDINFVGSEFFGVNDIQGLDGKPLGDRNPSYAKVDLAASYVLFNDLKSLKKLTMYGSILNLFDEEYTEVMGAPSPGINFLAGLKAEF
jgi:vitamin B12 transporter